jgi:hypothetical protein
MVSDKLLKIKKWIGLDEAAERLSSIVEGRYCFGFDRVRPISRPDIVSEIALWRKNLWVGKWLTEVPITTIIRNFSV